MSLLNLWATVGAAIVGVVTLFGFAIAEHLEQKRRRQILNQQMTRISQRVGQLEKRETAVNERGVRPQIRRHRRSPIVSSPCSDEYLSARDSSGTESDEETASTAPLMSAVDVSLRDIDQLLEQPSQVHNAFGRLKSLLRDLPNDAKILWRMGKANYHISLGVCEIVEKLKCINGGMDLCRRALSAAPNCGDAHKWYAILVGARCEQRQSNREKMDDGVEFKKHIDRAIELMPKDATLHYLLGRYTMEIAGLTWLERTGAAMLYEALPECSYDDALDSFLTAHRFGKKDWKMNLLCIGKCYAALGNGDEAIMWLDAAKEAACEDMLEAGAKAEIDALVQKYAEYRYD